MFKPTKQHGQQAALTANLQALQAQAIEAGKLARWAMNNHDCNTADEREALWQQYENRVSEFNAAATNELGAENVGFLLMVAN